MNALQKLQERYAIGEARALYELVLSQRFGLSRTDILLGKDTTLSAKEQEELQIIIDRVAKGEPVQYVLGQEEFCGRAFLVGPGVLIPRPETQQLIGLIKQKVSPKKTILDIGTGSGCIAITLALEGYKVSAFDISNEALSYARKNAERLGAEVDFRQENILQPEPSHECWDAIVSNPPYICKSEAEAMDENVLEHEPHLALFVPDEDPLLFYRAIAEFAQQHLADKGWIFFEINRAYPKQVEELLLQKGYKEVKIVKDEFDNNRFVCARKK